MNRTTLERRDESTAKRTILAVVGPKGAVHYWHQQREATYYDDRTRYGGVEVHWRQKPEWASSDEPDRDDCWLLGGPCWHDGSSLYAEEVAIPKWELCNDLDDMESFWLFLEREYRDRFEKDEE